MNSVLTDKIDAIFRACERFRVEHLDVFRSALRDDFDPKQSDINFLVEFGSMAPSDKPDAYFGLIDELRTIIGT